MKFSLGSYLKVMALIWILIIVLICIFGCASKSKEVCVPKSYSRDGKQYIGSYCTPASK
jgi:hypothetical protein